MTSFPVDPAPESNSALPSLGFIGWGPESAGLLELLADRDPSVVERATLLGGEPGSTPLTRVIPTAEGLLQSADLIIVEGEPAVLEPHLPGIRLAISDRHVLILMGGGWSLEFLLGHLAERKLARVMVLPSVASFPSMKDATGGATGGSASASSNAPRDTIARGTVVFHAAPYFSPDEMAAFRDLFGEAGVCAELREESQFETLQGLSDFAPAAFYTMLDAMADGMVMMGVPRTTALDYLAVLMHGAVARLVEPGATPARLREESLTVNVAAAGMIELESSGWRGTVMRAVQSAVGLTGYDPKASQRASNPLLQQASRGTPRPTNAK